ncbi:uncharacterized protein LOC133024046 isoform X1 [Limanda limanda]|uniref:uncharacterized protein LOC133024046 isoform X1 n=1 Tax=Limanda limanda TaxID=27771 RepID=UPI0029C6E6CC|nr:uncharacterized protein LOC133024046 isoform X1 [Limanda limanda]
MSDESRNYQSFPDMEQIITATWRLFFVVLSGTTNNTHGDFVRMIKNLGHTEVTDPEACDYCLLFCPITSRVGTDVDLSLRKIPGNKPTILVVMYHTFDRDHVVPDSRRLTEDPRVKLAVSCLFYEQNLLSSNCNDTAKYEIRKFLGLPQVTTGFPKIPLSIRRYAIWALVSLPCFLIWYNRRAFVSRFRNVFNYMRKFPGYNILAITNICCGSSSVDACW